MQKKEKQSKQCETCGIVMHRKRFGKRLEDLTRCNRRRHCCRSCANTRKNPTVAGLRWRAEQMRLESCEKCGSKEQLHAHHKDKNITNNVRSNIMTLCASCHAKHHHAERKVGGWLWVWQKEWTELSALETQSFLNARKSSQRQSGKGKV